MRRHDREITAFDDMVAVVKRCDVCRLGFSDAAEPYIVPLNFGMKREEDRLTLYFHCAREGRKLALFRQNPRVCFEMDCDHALQPAADASHCTMRYACVMGTGTLEQVEGEEKREALCRLMEHYGQTATTFPAPVLAKTVALKLTVETISGKRHG